MLTYFLKHLILGVLEGSEYTSVICIFGNIEDASKTDSVVLQIYSFLNSTWLPHILSLTLSKTIMIET